MSCLLRGAAMGDVSVLLIGVDSHDLSDQSTNGRVSYLTRPQDITTDYSISTGPRKKELEKHSPEM